MRLRKKHKLLIGGAIILLTMGFLIYGGLRETLVYFVTPSELKAHAATWAGKSLRLGGLVVTGSLHKDRERITIRFELTDGQQTVPVFHKGTAPDLFGEGRGAVVEGRYGPDGEFRSTTILAKHSEDYHPPAAGTASAEAKEMYRSLIKPGEGK